MGYTHYWEIKKIKGQADKSEKAYQRAIRDCAKIIKAYYAEFGGLSGYTAHTELGKYGGIGLNGKGEDGHEEFVLREHFSENPGFAFCKTAHKPYDDVVVACLTVLKHRLGEAIEVSSDGDPSEWDYGVQYAGEITKLKIKNPIGLTQLMRSC